MNQMIIEWQNILPSLNVGYYGPKDGKINSEFIEAMMALEVKYKFYGQLIDSSGVKISVDDAKQKFLNKVTIDVSKQDQIPDEDKWVNFFSQSLPIVGKIYKGNLAESGKEIERFIEKSIKHPMSGIIWNDKTKQFNTTPDDIIKALELLQKHQSPEVKAAKMTLDQRVIKMSQLLIKK